MNIKKRGIVVLLTLFLLVFLAFSVSAVTSITDCKYDIDTQGDYNLTQAITSTGQPCINITSSNVTLNCKGFSLTGAGMNPGVWINRSLNNITIKNCKFDLFAPNIYAPLGGKEIYIINNTINSSPSYGVYFITINNSRIENNTIAYNGDEDNEAGIYAYFSNHNLIKNNTIIHGGVTSESVYGVRINTGESNNITDNFIFNNSDMGIITESSPNTRIINNIIENNSWSNDDMLGIYIVLNANKTVVINNTVRHHSYGIYMTYADHVNITDNTVNNNSNGGIVALDGKYILIKNNFVYNNTYGIGLVTYVDANITNNTIQDETYGIFSQANTENSSVYRNTIKGGDNGMTFISNSRYNTIKYNNISSTVDILVKSSLNNKFFDNTVSSYPTQFSFVEYSGDVNVSGVSTPPATSPYRNISLYLNVSGTDWVVMNISYADADISNIEENSLTMMNYDGSSWSSLSSSLDTGNRDVSANLSSFSIFSLLANPPCGVVNEDLTLLSNISTITSCLIINSSNLIINCNNNNITGTKATNSRGVHLNYTQNVTIINCNVYNFTSGIYVYTSHNSTISNNTVGLNANGLDIENNSAENIFTNNNASDSSNSDIHIETGVNNKFFNITVGPIPTIIGFSKYNGTVHLRGISNPYSNLSGKRNVSSYVNITKTDGDYIELNISYSDTVVSNNNIDESTLNIYEYVNSAWSEITDTLDSTNNVLYSNITSFSVFGIFGDEITQSSSTGGGGGGGGYPSAIIKNYNTTDNEDAFVFIPAEPEIISEPILKPSIATEETAKQKVTGLARQMFPSIAEEKSSFLPILGGIIGVIIVIVLAIFLWYEKSQTRFTVQKRVLRSKETKKVTVPIKKTSFKPGLLKAFKDLKKKKIIDSIIRSKKEPTKTVFYPSLSEAFKDFKNKKKAKSKNKKIKKKKPVKNKSKEKKAIQKLRTLSKQEKQPNVFDDLQRIYSDIAKEKK